MRKHCRKSHAEWLREVDAEKARATYDEGLVTLRVPLVAGVEPKETKVRIRKARAKRPEALAAKST